MPIIDVPGQGQVDFPDSMSDDEIVAAIKRNSPTKPEVTATDRANAVGSGANSGIAGILGLPMDTAMNVVDLANAGLGMGASLFNKGKVPAAFENIVDRSKVGGSSEWIRNLFDKNATTSTQIPRPDDTASQYLHAGGSALPGIMAARPETLGQVASATAANVLPSLAAKGAADASRGTQFETTAPILASLATQAAPSAVSYAAKAATPKPDVDTAHAASILEKAGVKLDAAQKTGSDRLKEIKSSLNDNPFTSSKQKQIYEQQLEDFTSAVLKTTGEKATAAKPEVMAAADRRIGGVIDNVYRRNSVNYDNQLHRELTDILDTAKRELTPDQMSVIQSQAENIVAKAFSGTGGIEGKAAHNIRQSLGRLTANQDPSIKHFAGELQSSMDEALQRSVKGDDFASLKQAREQYRALKQIEPAIDKEGDGMISPARLANAAAANKFGGRKQFFYGRGDQSLTDLAKAGNKLIPDKAPNSGTPKRMMMQAIPAAVGAAGASAMTGNLAPAALVGAGYFGLPKLQQSLLNSSALTGKQNISNERLQQYLLMQSLQANQGR